MCQYYETWCFVQPCALNESELNSLFWVHMTFSAKVIKQSYGRTMTHVSDWSLFSVFLYSPTHNVNIVFMTRCLYVVYYHAHSSSKTELLKASFGYIVGGAMTGDCETSDQNRHSFIFSSHCPICTLIMFEKKISILLVCPGAPFSPHILW